MKRILCWVLILTMTAAALPALAVSFPAGADSFLFPEGNAAFSVSAELNTLPLYGKETMDMLRRALKHLSATARLEEDGTLLGLFAEDAQAAYFRQQSDNGAVSLTTDMLPGRTLLTEGDPIALLIGGEETEPLPSGFDLYAALAQAEKAYPAVAEAIAPFASAGPTNYTIKDVGHASWAVSARLTREDSASIHDALCDLLCCGLSGEAAENVRALVFLKALTVTLYQTEEGGEDFAVAVKGNVKHPSGASYEINYRYAFSGKEAHAAGYKLEIGKGKRGGITVNVKCSEKPGYAAEITGTFTFRSADGKIQYETADTCSLKGAEEGDARTLTGEITRSVKTAQDSKSTVVEETYTPDLRAENGVLTGSVNIRSTRDRETDTDVTLLFAPPKEVTVSETASGAEDALAILILDEAPDTVYDTSGDPDGFLVGTPPEGVTAYSAPAESMTLRLENLSAEDLNALRGELMQNTAAHLLVAMLKHIPEEDLTLLSDNTDPEAFSALLDRMYTVE